jgi:hypothetical protein
VRRNTRAKRAAALRGEEYETKIYAATGLAHEHGREWASEGPLTPNALDVEDEADRNLLLAALANASSPEFFTRDPKAAGALFGVASHAPLTLPQAKRALEVVEELREASTPPERDTFIL